MLVCLAYVVESSAVDHDRLLHTSIHAQSLKQIVHSLQLVCHRSKALQNPSFVCVTQWDPPWGIAIGWVMAVPAGAGWGMQ